MSGGSGPVTGRAGRLATQVRDFFHVHAREFGLDANAVKVRYVFNWGGFVNYSYRIFDGKRDLHLKLAAAPDSKAALTQWFDVAGALERHHAPHVLVRVEVDGAMGLVFPAVPGGIPKPSTSVTETVLECLRGLWSDESLAARLPCEDGRTAATCYLDTYHNRFTEDLRSIDSASLPFLAKGDLEFMRAEVENLRQAVTAHPAFGQIVSTPIHGDMWLNNMVWDSRASWYIVDWDDLQIGDPAMDVAMLTGPTLEDLTPLKYLETSTQSLGGDPALRLTLLGRASLLDWAIDPLADWIEAGVVGPDHAPRIRTEKEQVHRRALALYRSLYRSAGE